MFRTLIWNFLKKILTHKVDSGFSKCISWNKMHVCNFNHPFLSFRSITYLYALNACKTWLSIKYYVTFMLTGFNYIRCKNFYAYKWILIYLNYNFLFKRENDLKFLLIITLITFDKSQMIITTRKLIEFCIHQHFLLLLKHVQEEHSRQWNTKWLLRGQLSLGS